MATPNTTATLADIDKITGLQSTATIIDNYATIHENTITVDGDSISLLSKESNGDLLARGGFIWGNALLNQPFKYIENFSVSGQRTDEILTRIDTTLATSAKYIFFVMGKNDVLQGKLYSDIVSYITQIFDKTQAAGKIIIMTTIIPSGDDTQTRIDLTTKLNLWIKEQKSIRKNYIVVDSYNAIIDPTTGKSKTNYTADGVHPSALGAYYIGVKFKEALENIVTPTDLFTNNNLADATQIVVNSNFIGGTTVATSWSGAGSNVTYSKDTINGKEVQTITGTSDTPADISLSQEITTNFSVDDTLFGIAEVEVTNITALDSLSFGLIANDGSSDLLEKDTLKIDSGDTIRFPNENYKCTMLVDNFVVPASTTKIIPKIFGGINGKIYVKRIQIFNKN